MDRKKGFLITIKFSYVRTYLDEITIVLSWRVVNQTWKYNMVNP